MEQVAAAKRQSPDRQRFAPGKRRPIAGGMFSHAEDAKDHNLPLTICCSVELLVSTDKKRAVAEGRQQQDSTIPSAHRAARSGKKLILSAN